LQGLAAEGLTNYDSILEEVDFRQSTFRGSLGRLNNAWKEFGVDTLSDDGNSGLSGLTNFVDKLTELLTFITDLPAGFKNLAINTGLFFTAIVGGLFAFEKFADIFLWFKKTKVVGLLTTGIKNLVVAIKTMTFAKAIAGLKAMGTAVGLLTKKLALMMLSPFFLIPVVIAGIIAALWWLWENSDKVNQFIARGLGWIGNKFRDIWNGIKKRISDFVTNSINSFKRFFGITKDMDRWWKVLIHLFGVGIGFIIGFFWMLPGRIGGAMAAMFNAVTSWWNRTRTWLLTSARDTISNVGNFFWSLPGNIATALSHAVAWVIRKFSEMRDVARNIASDMVNGVVNFFRNLPGNISNALGSLWSIGSSLFKSFINGLISAAGALGGGIKAGLRLAGVPGFKDGGIVGGNDKRGDKVLIRANSGEMILNMAQQASLFNMIDSGSFAGAGAGDIMITINNPSVRSEQDLRDMKRMILDTVNQATRKKELGV
jgi:hypothetical protein